MDVCVVFLLVDACYDSVWVSTIWRLYAVCSHAFLVQLVMCHQSARMYLDVGHYPGRESAGCLWQQNYLLAQNCFEWDLLFALALIRIPLSHSLSLYLALIVPLKCAPPPSVFFFCISDKHTPVFAKGERERAGNRLLEHRPKRSAPCSFLFCFFFSFFFFEGWVLTQDKVSGSGV